MTDTGYRRMTDDEHAAYIVDNPRRGVVRIYLDGTAKHRTFPRLIASTWIGQSGLLDIQGRSVYVDAADLDELYDAIVYIDTTSREAMTMHAIAKQIHTLITTTQGATR